jgi:hypothetical protein
VSVNVGDGPVQQVGIKFDSTEKKGDAKQIWNLSNDVSGDVLAGRAGLRTRQQTLDQFALTAAYYEIQSGRHWRSLQDTTNDAIIDPGRRPLGWSNWQRFEDYYSEAELVYWIHQGRCPDCCP